MWLLLLLIPYQEPAVEVAIVEKNTYWSDTRWRCQYLFLEWVDDRYRPVGWVFCDDAYREGNTIVVDYKQAQYRIRGRMYRETVSTYDRYEAADHVSRWFGGQ